MGFLALHIGKVVSVEVAHQEIGGVATRIVTAWERRGSYTQYTDGPRVGTVWMRRHDPATAKRPAWTSGRYAVAKDELPDEIAKNLRLS